MAEDVLISIKLDGTENEAKVDSYTSSIVALNKSNKELIEANKELAKQGQENSKAYLDNAKQVEINKQKITENTASRKNLISAIINEDNSIKGLQVRNAELIRQRNSINIGTEEGRKRIAAINSQLDSNNAKIKENSSALEKQKLNIGNYASALDGVVPGLGGMITGLQGATKAALAFIATPIGAVLAAVVAALATLKAAILTNDATADEFGKRWEQITAVFDVVLRRVGLLGDALVSLVKGDFSEAADKAASAFSGVNDELGRAIFLTGELADRQNELDDAVNKFNATEQARKNNIDKLIIQSKDLSKSEAERLRLSTQAETLLNKLTEDRIALSVKQSDIDIEAIGLKHDAQRDLNETTKDYGLRLLENSAIGGEEAEKIAAAIRKIDEAEAESLRTLEKLQNQQNKLSEERQLRVIEDSELTKEIRTREAEDTISLQEGYQEKSTELTTSFEENILKVKDSFRKKDLDNQKKANDLAIAREQLKQQLIFNLQMASIAFARQLAGQNRGIQSGLTLIETYLSAQKAFSSQIIPTDPTSFGRAVIAAVTATIAGLTRVAAINNVSFAAGGGEFITRGPTMLVVGDNPGGVERVSVTPISGKGQTKVSKGLVQMAGGGSFTAMNDTRSIVNQTVQTVLVLEDFEYKQRSKYETLNEAKVL